MPRPYKKQGRRGKSADADADAPTVTENPTDEVQEAQENTTEASQPSEGGNVQQDAASAADAPTATLLATPSKAPHMSASLASPCIPPTPPPTPATTARPPPPPLHGVGTTTFGDDEAGEQPRRPSVDGDTMGMVNPRLAQAGDPLRSPTAEARHHHDHYVPDPPTNEPVTLGSTTSSQQEAADSLGATGSKHVTISPMAQEADEAPAAAAPTQPDSAAPADTNSRLARAGDPLRSPKGEAHHSHDHYVPDPAPSANPVIPGEPDGESATHEASKSGSSKHVTISPVAHDAQTPMVPMRSATKSPAPAILKNTSDDQSSGRRWRDERADVDGDAAAAAAAPHRIPAKPTRGATQWAVDVGVAVAVAAFISRCL